MDSPWLSLKYSLILSFCSTEVALVIHLQRPGVLVLVFLPATKELRLNMEGLLWLPVSEVRGVVAPSL